MKKTQSVPTFAVRLRSLRQERGLSQPQLARDAGLSQQLISYMERGQKRPGWETVQRLAAALGVSTEEFRS